jgi:predicted phosphohydrolase
MQISVDLVKPTTRTPEIAVLQVSSEEHAILHKPVEGKKLVNDKHVFKKEIRELKMAPHAATEAIPEKANWMIMLVHMPQCTACGTCLAVPET